MTRAPITDDVAIFLDVNKSSLLVVFATMLIVVGPNAIGLETAESSWNVIDV